jgi:cyclophilin family peptidyl-prolyl cis-trans isomerase
MKNILTITFLLISLFKFSLTMAQGNILNIQLKDGLVKAELFPKTAPNHVERIKTLSKKGFYDGVLFHRVIEGFMAQTGDPTGTGTGGSDLPDLKAEFSNISHQRGVLSMARAMNPNSANSQFFIVTEDSPHLDGQYSAFGKVISGMEFVDMIKKGYGGSGMVDNPDKMIKVWVD